MIILFFSIFWITVGFVELKHNQYANWTKLKPYQKILLTIIFIIFAPIIVFIDAIYCLYDIIDKSI